MVSDEDKYFFSQNLTADFIWFDQATVNKAKR